MSDPLTTQLDQLAPNVDLKASRAMFDRRRARSAHTIVGIRSWLVAATITLVVGGLVGVWATAGRGGDEPSAPVDTPTTITSSRTGAGYEVVAVDAGSGGEASGWPKQSVNATALPSGFENLRAEAGLEPPAPTIDFGAAIVVVIERPGNACPDRLVGFDIVNATWTSVFEPATEACEDIGLTWVYTIAIDRAAIGPVTTFTVPADEAFGLEPVSTSLDLRSPIASQADPEVEVIGVTISCGAGFPRAEAQATVALVTAGAANLELRIEQDGTLLGSASATTSGGSIGVGFTLSGSPEPGTRLIVTDTSGKVLTTGAVEPTDCGYPAGSDTPVGSDVSVPLPAPGTVASEWTREFGPLWVIHHADGSVSILPSVVSHVDGTADGSDLDGVGYVVAWSPSGRAFTAGARTFDEWGRTVDGPRSNDLAGLLGSIDGAVVDVSPTRADRISGEPDRVGAASDLTPPSLPPSIGSATTTDVPGWFVLDEWLVIVNGSGTLCDADRALDCDPTTGRVTAVTSSDTERTVWLPAPLIAHFDAAGSVDTAVSLGGVFPTSEPTIIEAGPSCGATDEATVRVRFSAPGPVDVIVEARQGGTLIGTATASLTEDLPWKTVQVPVTVYVDADDPLAEIVIRSVDLPDEQLAVGTVDFSLDRKSFGCPI